MIKLNKLKDLALAGKWDKALQMAARFPVLGKEKKTIEQAYNAIQHPEFYKQLGYNPQELVESGIAALKNKYSI